MSFMARNWEERLDDDDEAVYPIGVVADLLDVSVQVVRRYDDEAVIEPERSDSGHRRYSRRDIARLAHVLEMADEGIRSRGSAGSSSWSGSWKRGTTRTPSRVRAGGIAGRAGGQEAHLEPRASSGV